MMDQHGLSQEEAAEVVRRMKQPLATRLVYLLGLCSEDDDLETPPVKKTKGTKKPQNIEEEPETEEKSTKKPKTDKQAQPKKGAKKQDIEEEPETGEEHEEAED